MDRGKMPSLADIIENRQKPDCFRQETYKPNNRLGDTVVGMTVLDGYPAVLFRHKGGYAWKYKNKIKDLGDISEERAIQKFEWNFGNRCM